MQELLAAAHHIIEAKHLLRPLLLGGDQAREALGVHDRIPLPEVVLL